MTENDFHDWRCLCSLCPRGFKMWNQSHFKLLTMFNRTFLVYIRPCHHVTTNWKLFICTPVMFTLFLHLLSTVLLFLCSQAQLSTESTISVVLIMYIIRSSHILIWMPQYHIFNNTITCNMDSLTKNKCSVCNKK